IKLFINSNALGTSVGTWDCTGLIVAGTKYLLEISYTSSAINLKVDGVLRITVPYSVNFVVLPTNLEFGSVSGTVNSDAVFS
ncbi:hypothetical protein IH575_03145, partial [Candidatus Dojkabacteria bacterium]|nr:hypothetical protein [Candidatus Dojkabacteria bacterium]